MTLASSHIALATHNYPDIEFSEDLVRQFDVSGPRYTSYPTADRFVSDVHSVTYEHYLQERATRADNPLLSVYVHLPFCQSLCYFCACNKVVTQDRTRSARYIDYLKKEMRLVARNLGTDRRTGQMHWGGGTPTFLSPDELARLMGQLRECFDLTPDAEIGIEIDPRTLTDHTLGHLASLGFNRTSFGVQDFDESVQQAVNRVQPLQQVEHALKASRDHGFQSINMDLIYGLPRQTYDSFSRTLDHVIRLSPDRIALYNYAHLPARFKAQRLINEQELPRAEDRLQIFMQATRRLLEAGYVYIGLDHFAKPGDELNKARLEGSLHRNFQGYTTRAEYDLVGLGVSAISKVGASYTQAVRSVPAYYEALDAGHLPIDRGIELGPDDLLRREIIMTIMCSMPVRYAQLADQWGIDFKAYFASEIERLQPMEQAGLLQLGQDALQVTAQGRLFVRAIGMVFDRYLTTPSRATYSKLI